MKLSNFIFKERTGQNCLSWVFHATVDVEKGCLWWKTKTTKKIQHKYGSSWFFVENGEWCIGVEVDKMARAWTAKSGEATR